MNDPDRQPPAHLDPAADYDALWRKQPTRLGFIHFARALTGYAAQFARPVPKESWLQAEPGLAQVTCPCGHTPRCERNVPVECTCNRVFAYVGSDVRVAYVDETTRTGA